MKTTDLIIIKGFIEEHIPEFTDYLSDEGFSDSSNTYLEIINAIEDEIKEDISNSNL